MAESAASTRPQTGVWSSYRAPGGGAVSGAVQVRQFILKIHRRCDLRCDYCYIYTMADQGVAAPAPGHAGPRRRGVGAEDRRTRASP